VSQPLGPGDHRHGLQFRASVELKDLLRPEPVDPRLLEPLRAGRGEVEGDLQRGHVSGQPDSLGQPPDAKHHRRHQQQPGHPVLAGKAQRLGRVEPWHDHDVIAEQHPGRGDYERRVV
jgi:hypothetical protein